MRFGKRHINLRSEMAIWAAVTAVILTLVLTAVSVVTATRHIEREAQDDVAILANDAAQGFDHRMSQNFRVSEMAAGLDVLRDPDATTAAKHAVLADLQMTYPDCLWVGIADTHGTVIASGDGRLVGSQVNDQAWFVDGLRQPMISQLHQPTDMGLALIPLGEVERVIDIARPLRDQQGNLIGVINATLSWKWALEFRAMLMRNRNAALGIDIMVTDKDGRVLIGPNTLIDQTLPFTAEPSAAEAGEASLPIIARDPAATRDPVTASTHTADTFGGVDLDLDRKATLTSALPLVVAHWPDGGDYLSAVGTGTGYQDFPGLGWNIVVRQPRDIANAPADAIRDRLITAGIVLAILFTGIGWVVADRITGSIRQLTDYARRLERGERGLIFPPRHRTREVAVLGETLHHLVDNLLQREQQLLDLNAHLETRIADRTALLAASNRQLEDEMGQRQAVETEREALIRQLRDQAEHDSLTGALNRRAFLAMAERDRRRLRRDDGRIAVIMIDIDHFKRVNDSYGHSVGDEVIRQIVTTARQTVRDGDLLCRYGGEEFALLLSDPGADSAALVAERLRLRVAALVFQQPRKIVDADLAAEDDVGREDEVRGADDRATDMASGDAGASKAGGTFQVTISLGLTIAPARELREDGVVSLIDRADQALYAAKHAGRNCTMIDQRVISEFTAPPGAGKTIASQPSDDRKPGDRKAGARKLIDRNAVSTGMAPLAHRADPATTPSLRIDAGSDDGTEEDLADQEFASRFAAPQVANDG